MFCFPLIALPCLYPKQNILTLASLPFTIYKTTDYGRPMKPFSAKFQTFGLGQTIWTDKFWGIWDIGQFISTVSPLSMFSKKLSLYIQIPNIIWD